MNKMWNRLKYPIAMCIFVILVVSCENPGIYDGGGGGGDPQRYFVNFAKQDDGSVLFYTNDPRMIGPSGYNYWCIGTYNPDPMEEFQVTVQKVSGSAAGGYGVIFSAQDRDNFLVLFINTRGFYKIGKVKDEDFTPFDTWLPSNDLYTGYVSNTIRIIYDEATSSYRVYFNDDTQGILFEDNDAQPFTYGYYGYICELDEAEDFPDTAVEVRFQQEDPADIGL